LGVEAVQAGGRHYRHKHGLAVAVRGIVHSLDAVLAHQGRLDAARNGAFPLKQLGVIKHLGGLGATDANGGLAHQPQPKNVGVKPVVAVRRKFIAFAQQRDGAI
jgi:hypothetical protein